MTVPRAQPGVVVSMPRPAIADGQPVNPALWAEYSVTQTLVQGAHHIRTIANPDPGYDDGSGDTAPEPAGRRRWKGRWTVRDLPDPPSNGYYLLGTPSTDDDTIGIASDARQWKCHGTLGAPAWHSAFPFKPSVRAFDSYLPNGDVVHHPKGVHFNSHFVQHMWLDWGGTRPQPFTWVIAGMIAAFPHPRYRHYLLDSGRNPSAVGFPNLTTDQLSDPREIKDGLGYRTLLAASSEHELACTRMAVTGGRTLRTRIGSHTRPKMFYGVYNGGQSQIGTIDPGGHRGSRGRLDNTAAQKHRYYVLGRRNGWISQAEASNIVLFEIRYWDMALNLEELNNQYDQLASTYQFHHYRNV